MDPSVFSELGCLRLPSAPDYPNECDSTKPTLKGGGRRRTWADDGLGTRISCRSVGAQRELQAVGGPVYR